jgi:hypothetical protein
MFWTHGSLLMEYTKVHKNIKMIGEHLIREKNFWYKKITCQHAFLECFKYIKMFLKHVESSWKFCNYNFEHYIRNDFKNKINFWYMFPWWFFKSSKKKIENCPHIDWLFLSYFHLATMFVSFFEPCVNGIFTFFALNVDFFN